MTNLALTLYVGIGLLSPFLVDLVTKKFTNDKVKTVTLLAINLVTGIVVGFSQALSNGQVFDWNGAFNAAVFAFVGGVGGVFGLKKLDIIGVNGPLANLKPDTGLGAVDQAKVVAAEEEAKDPLFPDIDLVEDPALFDKP